MPEPNHPAASKSDAEKIKEWAGEVSEMDIEELLHKYNQSCRIVAIQDMMEQTFSEQMSQEDFDELVKTRKMASELIQQAEQEIKERVNDG